MRAPPDAVLRTEQLRVAEMRTPVPTHEEVQPQEIERAPLAPTALAPGRMRTPGLAQARTIVQVQLERTVVGQVLMRRPVQVPMREQAEQPALAVAQRERAAGPPAEQELARAPQITINR